MSFYEFEKLFKEKGYYDHCRARYDLVLSEKEKMKEFLNISESENISVHFLFVSSKPLEIEFQDNDGTNILRENCFQKLAMTQ